ncbi:type I restriction endonuclease subunit M [Vibrio sp. PNB22_3_1]
MQKFKLGETVATRKALEAIENDQAFINRCLYRHATGDWGQICEEDAETNNEALASGGRLMSVYSYGQTKIWFITESDRSVTTMLLPSDY